MHSSFPIQGYTGTYIVLIVFRNPRGGNEHTIHDYRVSGPCSLSSILSGTQCFGNWSCFHSQEKLWGTPSSVASLGWYNLCNWKHYVLLRIPDNGQVQESNNPKCSMLLPEFFRLDLYHLYLPFLCFMLNFLFSKWWYCCDTASC